MILLDTHALAGWLLDAQRLGRQTRRIITEAWSDSDVAVSGITFWEIAGAGEKGRLELQVDVVARRDSLLNEGLIEVAVDGEIAVRADSLRALHGDPADRITDATALAGHKLLTADQRIFDWPWQLHRLDATN